MSSNRKDDSPPTQSTDLQACEVESLIDVAIAQKSGIHALRAAQLIRKSRLRIMSDESLGRYAEATAALALLDAPKKRREIKARYSGKCPFCEAPWEKGDWIAWNRHAKPAAVCLNCKDRTEAA